MTTEVRRHEIPDGYEGAPAAVVVTGKQHKFDDMIGLEVIWSAPGYTARPFASMSTEAARKVAEALVTELNHMEGSQLRILDNSGVVTQYWGRGAGKTASLEDAADALAYSVAPKDEVQMQNLERIPPCHPDHRGMWEKGYTFKVWSLLDKLVIRSTRGEIAIRAAKRLLRQYWDDLHIPYEQRDAARKALADLRKELAEVKADRDNRLAKQHNEAAEEIQTLRKARDAFERRMRFWRKNWYDQIRLRNEARARVRELEAQLAASNAKKAVDDGEVQFTVLSPCKCGKTKVSPGLISNFNFGRERHSVSECVFR